MLDPLNCEEAYRAVKRVINERDPVKLIGGGAPEDEYDKEINQIISLLQKHLQEDALTQGIYNIFVRSFGNVAAGTEAVDFGIAKELMS